RNFSRLWQKVHVKMRDTSRLSRDFVPPVHQDPANETTGAFVIAEVTGQRAEKQPDILVKRVELILQRLARTQQVAANLAVHLQKRPALFAALLPTADNFSTVQRMIAFANASALFSRAQHFCS